MEVKSLFDEALEAELRTWLSKFGGLAALYAGLPQLFLKLSAQHIEGTVEDRVSIKGPVHIGSRSTVRAGSLITGPVIIAEDVTIASSVELSEKTYIGSGCSIAHGVTIKNSLLLNGTSVGPGAYISDSIIGVRCVVGPHAMLGVEPTGVSKNGLVKPNFVTVRRGSRVGAGAILEYGAAIAEGATVDNGKIVPDH